VLGDLGEPMQLLCGALLCEAAWRIDLRADWMVALGDLSFGVYLIHPFFILVVDKFFADAGFWGAWALVAGLSVAAVLVARRLPLVRELI
jgi:peptidoglycan/LPS O-acetylase OafA/YrhL